MLKKTSTSSVVEDIYKQVKKDPNKIALITSARQITYGELWSSAVLAAQKLPKTNQLSPMVLITCEKKEDAIAAYLASFMACYCAVPLHAGASTNILPQSVREGLAAFIDGSNGTSIVFKEIGIEPVSIEWSSREIDESEFSILDIGDSPAYLLLTSGTTGNPKAVEQSHRGLYGNMVSYATSIKATDEDVFSLLPAYSVDAGIMDIFTALILGASIAVWETQRYGVIGLLSWIEKNKITILHGTPTVIRLLTNQSTVSKENQVRTVVFGGEPLATVDLKAISRYFRVGTIYVNGLGPSECTIALQHQNTVIENDEEIWPVGTPIAGVTAAALDDDGVSIIPLHATIPRQLVLFSPDLATGYAFNEEETHKRFQYFEGKGRGYLTGDLVIQKNSAEITFVGRNDFRVKVAGVFIDPIAIRDRLTKEARLRWADVFMYKDTTSLESVLLIAYVEGEQAVAEGDIKTAANAMIEGAPIKICIYKLTNAALTASGKSDKSALRNLYLTSFKSQDELARGLLDHADLSSAMNWLWSSMLDCSPTEKMNFFEQGGNSLMLMKFINLLSRRFAVENLILDWRKQPTFKGLHQAFNAALLKPSGSNSLLLEVESNCYADATELHVRLAEPCASHILLREMVLPGTYANAELQDALKSIFENEGFLYPYKQCVSQQKSTALTYHVKITDQRKKIPQYATEIFSDIQVAVVIFIDSSDTRINEITIAVSHIHFDGSALTEFIRRLYLQLKDGWGLAANPLQIKNKKINCDLGYWNSIARDLRTPLFPTERDVPAHDGWLDHQTELFTFRTKFSSDSIRESARHFGMSAAAIFLAAFSRFFCSETEATSVCIGLAINVRGHFGITQDSIGNYTNLVPCIINACEEEKFPEFVTLVQGMLTSATMHGAIPYGKILELQSRLKTSKDYFRNRITYSYMPMESPSDDTNQDELTPLHIGWSASELAITVKEYKKFFEVQIEHTSALSKYWLNSLCDHISGNLSELIYTH